MSFVRWEQLSANPPLWRYLFGPDDIFDDGRYLLSLGFMFETAHDPESIGRFAND